MNEHYHIKAMLPHHTGAADVCWTAMGALGLQPQADASARRA